jgi:APA family basic amino acid/polyamine antiporter
MLNIIVGLLSQGSQLSLYQIVSPVRSNKPNKQDKSLGRVLGTSDLVATGLSCTVGVSIWLYLLNFQAGIFITLGIAGSVSGAGLLIALLLASLAALLSALCHAEYGASLPVAGSTYSYVYATFGELLGWM